VPAWFPHAWQQAPPCRVHPNLEKAEGHTRKGQIGRSLSTEKASIVTLRHLCLGYLLEGVRCLFFAIFELQQ
jgi:hypothetical protein